jgi:MFS family permease
MDLDELKQHLKNQEVTTTQQEKSAEALSLLLKNNQQSPINKIKRSLVFEIVCTALILIPCFYVVLFTKIWSLRVYFLVLLVICIYLGIHLVLFLRKINRLNNTVLPVKKNIEQVYARTKNYVKRSFQVTMGMLPVFFVLAFSLGFYEGKTGDVAQYDKLVQHFTSLNQIVILTLAYIILTSIGMYYFTKWYLKKLYGKYLEELKLLLEELNENNLS